MKKARIQCDDLDLSRITSEYGKQIHPCKGCVSTAMPLCHWPCSCYPNHALGQVNDWMNEIYPRWSAAHGIVIVTQVYWYQVPSALKLMIDRLVCADGGNPDPTSTQGKDAKKAKQIELAGWPESRDVRYNVRSDSSAICSISACSQRSTGARSSPARPACRRRCRSATGRAPATRTTPWGRRTTG